MPERMRATHTVIGGLMQAGLSSPADVAGHDPKALQRRVAQRLRTTCWNNGPLAPATIAEVADQANTKHTP